MSAPQRHAGRTSTSPSQGATRLSVVRRRGRALVKRSASTRFASLGIVGTIAVVAIIMGVLLEQVVLAQSAFKLSRITRKIEMAEDRREELMLRSARLESPARIERYAKQRLGMVEPASISYIVADVRLRSDVRLARRDEVPLRATGQAAAAERAESGQ